MPGFRSAFLCLLVADLAAAQGVAPKETPPASVDAEE